MSDVKEALHAVVERLTEEGAGSLLEVARDLHASEEQAVLLDVLMAIPGVTVPDRWPFRFRDVEPLAVSGKPASELLSEDR